MNDSKINFFKKAIPIWASGKENEINSCIELVCRERNISGGILKIAGATSYQVFADGRLIHHGPARKAEGYSAVDLIELSDVSELTVRAVGYNCRSFSGVTQSSFIQAEIEKDGKIEAATGFDGFSGYEALYHRQKVMRYSYQRYFSESWDFTLNRRETDLSEVNRGSALVQRIVPYGEYKSIWTDNPMRGKWEYACELRMPLFPYLSEPNDEYTHFLWEELQSYAYEEYLKTNCDYSAQCVRDDNCVSGGECRLYNFGKIEAGFIRIKMRATKKTRIILAFAEQLDESGRPAMRPLNSVNVIEWVVPAGEYDLISCEAYTVKYAEIIVAEGEAEIDKIGVCEVAFPENKMKLEIPKDTELAEIYTAAAETFRHNTVDIFLDCPSRERAGWLFDSFYTARSEYHFTGEAVVEKAFLNNYLYGKDITGHKGMVNMCYPADVFSGTFIPQWAMWYVLEINEYLKLRKGELNENVFKKQLDRLLVWFSKYENEYGLLEKLDGWNFVEWSEVNHRVHDVNWATNMLYSEMLCVIGRMYDREDWICKGISIKDKIRDMAFDGVMFCDRAMRNLDGRLENTNERSEVTQYYALKFNVADIEDDRYSKIKHMVLDVFGPERKEYPEIEKADSMPGLYLRMELLNKWGRHRQLLDEIKGYFLNMARDTGTLWERYEGRASRDHGFASYVAVAISEAIKSIGE